MSGPSGHRENERSYDLALRVGGIMMQQLLATRIRLLDICEVSQS